MPRAVTAARGRLHLPGATLLRDPVQSADKSGLRILANSEGARDRSVPARSASTSGDRFKARRARRRHVSVETCSDNTPSTFRLRQRLVARSTTTMSAPTREATSRTRGPCVVALRDPTLRRCIATRNQNGPIPRPKYRCITFDQLGDPRSKTGSPDRFTTSTTGNANSRPAGHAIPTQRSG